MHIANHDFILLDCISYSTILWFSHHFSCTLCNFLSPCFHIVQLLYRNMSMNKMNSFKFPDLIITVDGPMTLASSETLQFNLTTVENNENFWASVQGPSYLGLIRSISWLLMPWLLTSPGHQQPWYWLCGICRSWSYLRKDFKYLCGINVE